MLFKNLSKTSNIIQIFLLGCSLSLLSSCTVTNPQKKINVSKSPISSSNNAKANLFIGGFAGGYHVIINKGIILYKNDFNTQNKNWVSNKITSQEIANLEKTFNSYNVSNWNKSYNDPRIQDGTYWRLIYTSKNVSINSYGNNSYPKDFKKVINYISSNLLKGKPYQ